MFDSSNQPQGTESPARNDSEDSKKTRKNAVEKLYSPKKVAAAIGVSESSLKRWCDAGYIKAVKTAGGHRRVAKAEVVSFIKRKNYELRDPVSIGLPDIRGVSFAGIDQARLNFLKAMLESDQQTSDKILCLLFIRGHNVAEIFDRVISPVFFEIGEKWEAGQLDVYQERLASQTCHRSLLELRSIIPAVNEDAPIAIGACLEDNRHELPTLGAELCLRNFGWKATSLGSNMPLTSVKQAVIDLRPSFVWISATIIEDRASFITKVNAFSESIAAATKVVIGGRAVDSEIQGRLTSTTYCENFAQLVMLARLPEKL